MQPTAATPFFQHAYVVNDIATAVERWHVLYGAGPFTVTPHHVAEEFGYRGTTQEADVSYAFGYLGELMIQFVEQHDDSPSIWREMFPRGAEGFHHVAILTADIEAAKARYASMGFAPACELRNVGVHAVYFDTRELTGGFTEFHNDPPRIVETFAGWRRAHETWTVGQPIMNVRTVLPSHDG